MGNRVAQMYEQSLDAIKGFYSPSALEKVRPLAAALLNSLTVIPAGRVAHIDAAGNWALGGSGTQMPCFLWQGSKDPDVFNDGVSAATGTRHWTSVLPSGEMKGVVATGGYELQTTEYDATQVYAPNQLLTASAVGILTNVGAVQYTNWICGVTSWHELNRAEATPATAPTGNNLHNVATLTFWTYFLPAAP